MVVSSWPRPRTSISVMKSWWKRLSPDIFDEILMENIISGWNTDRKDNIRIFFGFQHLWGPDDKLPVQVWPILWPHLILKNLDKSRTIGLVRNAQLQIYLYFASLVLIWICIYITILCGSHSYMKSACPNRNEEEDAIGGKEEDHWHLFKRIYSIFLQSF